MTRLGIIAGLTVASLAGAFWTGWNYGRASMRADMAEAYQRTIEEYNDAGIPVDPAAIRCRLRELAGLEPCNL